MSGGRTGTCGSDGRAAALLRAGALGGHLPPICERWPSAGPALVLPLVGGLA